MAMEETDQAWNKFRAAIPEHVCEDANDCPHPEGFYVLLYEDKENGTLEQDVMLHGMSLDGLAKALVATFDKVVEGLAPDHIPAFVAFARGRDLLRQVLESEAAPPDASQGLQDLLERFLREVKDSRDE